MSTDFQLKIDGFTQIYDSSEISELIDMYKDSRCIIYAAVACSQPSLLALANKQISEETDVIVQSILTVSPNDVNEDIITSISIKGIHIDFSLCNGEKDLKNIGMFASKCTKFNIMTYISNMEWSTFEKLLSDYQSDSIFVYVVPSNEIQDTLKKLQNRLAIDNVKIKEGTLPSLFSVIGLYDVHNHPVSMKWLAEHVPLILETTGIGTIRPIELSSTTSQLFLLEKHETAKNTDTSIIGSEYTTFMLKQIIGRTKWTSG